MLPAGLRECRRESESHESGSLRYRAATAKMAPKEPLIVAYYDDNPRLRAAMAPRAVRTRS